MTDLKMLTCRHVDRFEAHNLNIFLGRIGVGLEVGLEVG
jgi:hypothetical protein